MIKLAAFDLDGTLLADDHITVSNENIEALRTLSSQGITIVLASGRTLALMQETIEALGCVDFVILSNGVAARSMQSGENIVLYSGLGSKKAAPILDILKQSDAIWEVYQEGNVYLEDQALERYRKIHASNPLYLRFLSCTTLIPYKKMRRLSCIEKINVSHISAACREGVMNSLKRIDGICMVCSYGHQSEPYDSNQFEINNDRISKGSCLKKLCVNLHIPASTVMAFGDAENDIEMLSWAKHSFAMKNARTAVKSYAKNSADYNFNNGVAKAIHSILK